MPTFSSVDIAAAILSVGIALYGAYHIANSKRSKLPLPPGPKPEFLIGNLRQIPLHNQPEIFAEWGRTYGGITSVRFLGNTMIILNTYQAARDLLEARGNIYSCRPRFVLFTEMLDIRPITTTLPYGDKYRKHRRIVQDNFSSQSIVKYRPLQELEAIILVQEMLETPERFRIHIRRFAAATIMKISFGHSVTSVDDKYVQMAEDTLRKLVELGQAGGAIVDFIPILKHIPSWMPGAGFKREAKNLRQGVYSMKYEPLEMVKQKMAAGLPTGGIISSLIERYSENGSLAPEDEIDIAGIGFVLYMAAADTTVAVVTAFIYAMVLYPEVYTKVREEMDRVLGKDRLPDLDDRESLPYLEAVLMEVYRWNAPAPLGMPHRLTEDDIYRGYFIPQNAMIIANIWAMCNDPEFYSNPSEFNPERFLKSVPEPNPKEIVFGFGRRVCPGRLLADASVWLAAATIASTLDIKKTESNPAQLPGSFTEGIMRHPIDFECSIEPISQKTFNMIHETRASREH